MEDFTSSDVVSASSSSLQSKVYVIMIGDSDIHRWPESLYPDLSAIISTMECTESGDKESITQKPTFVNVGKDGALLQNMPDQIGIAMNELSKIASSSKSTSKSNRTKEEETSKHLERTVTRTVDPQDHYIFIACAGENDVSSGYNLDIIVSGVERTCDEILNHLSVEDNASRRLYFQRRVDLLLLGPKYEPWQHDDQTSRKQYSKLSRSLNRACNRLNSIDRQVTSPNSKHDDFKFHASYIDCLLLFCGETAHLPGAVTACRAVPEVKYFAPDGLHLNHDGYRIWKQCVEKQLEKVLTATER